ncbi:MAG: hypothetical protein Q7T73_09895, partial [Beijerinckiaceae bacterium]|nr:hypothetical protein [Beijerinckiaceae bacterium]
RPARPTTSPRPRRPDNTNIDLTPGGLHRPTGLENVGAGVVPVTERRTSVMRGPDLDFYRHPEGTYFVVAVSPAGKEFVAENGLDKKEMGPQQALHVRAQALRANLISI